MATILFLIIVSLVLLLLGGVGWLIAQLPERKPNLKADIICATVQGARNTDTATDDWNCFLTMCVNIENTGADTTILNFDCEVYHRGRAADIQRIENLAGYEQFCSLATGDDPSAPKRNKVWQRLFDFPADALLTKGKPVRGWLRFHIRSLPAEAMRSETGLTDEVLIELWAISGTSKVRNLHLIYQGPEPNNSCGEIRTIEII